MPSSSIATVIPRGDPPPPPADSSELEKVAASEPFGVMLKRLRRRKNLTMAHVADALGVSVPSVWAWENGKCRPHPARIGSIAVALGVMPEDLAGVVFSSSNAAEVIEDCRERIAIACGTNSRSVRIMVEF